MCGRADNTTSFSVSGEYEADLDAHTLAVTYGYSRDRRADLKQWMLALATTRQGDVPLFCQALDAPLCRRRGRLPLGPLSWCSIRMLIGGAFSTVA